MLDGSYLLVALYPPAVLLAVALSLFLASTTVIEQSIDIVTAIRGEISEPEPEPEPEQDAEQMRLVVISAGSIAVIGTLLLGGIVTCSRSRQTDKKRRRSSVNDSSRRD